MHGCYKWWLQTAHLTPTPADHFHLLWFFCELVFNSLFIRSQFVFYDTFVFSLLILSAIKMLLLNFGFVSICLLVSVVGSASESGGIHKMRVITDPVSLSQAYVNAGREDGDVDEDSNELKLTVQPSNFSGPDHFLDLIDRCFSLRKGGFEYRLCPFKNATQKEISYGFNRKRYHGLIGVWFEWIVEDFHLAGWKMENGDECPGNKPRSTQVDFACGDSYSLYDVSEPKQCHYRMTFKLPQACQLDSLLVYPLLGDHARNSWDILEGIKLTNEITEKGYEEELRKILIGSGSGLLQPPPGSSKSTATSRPANGDDKLETVVKPETTASTPAAFRERPFSSLELCQQAYDELVMSKKTTRLA